MRRFLLLLVALASFGAGATVINVAACTDTAIDNAITSAVSGDTVLMPASCASFTASIVIPSTKGIVFDGNGGTFSSTTTISVTPNASTATRVTNFTIACHDGAIIASDGLTSARWRFDHITMTGSSHRCFNSGLSYGLLDHITAVQLSGADEFIHMEHGPTPGSGSSYTLDGWDTAVNPGSDEAVYVEDSTFTCSDCAGFPPAWFESFYGARTVYRFNTFNDVAVDAHGTAGNIGARWWEYYHNTVTTATAWNRKITNFRAGSGIGFGNTKDAALSGYGVCEEDSSAYPAAYQIGRGTSGVLYPAYFFDDTISVGLCSDATHNGSVTANVDYYSSVGASCTSGGSCTTGVGSGTSLPTSCTTGVGYWKTDEGGNWNTLGGGANDGKLYKCTATDTWTAYYTPLTYPHPLQGSLLAAPTNLRARPVWWHFDIPDFFRKVMAWQ